MEYIEDCKNKVHELLVDQRIGPELRIQDFDDYIDLINGKVSKEIYDKKNNNLFNFIMHCR